MWFSFFGGFVFSDGLIRAKPQGRLKKRIAD